MYINICECNINTVRNTLHCFGTRSVMGRRKFRRQSEVMLLKVCPSGTKSLLHCYNNPVNNVSAQIPG